MAKLAVPTFIEAVAAYKEMAVVERMKNDRPSVRTVGNVVNGVCRMLSVAGMDGEEPITAMTRRRIDSFLAIAPAAGIESLTAWSYVFCLRSLVAVWTRPYYSAQGYRVAPFDIPPCRRRAARYLRPDRDSLLKVRDWYESLRFKPDKREWLVATLMLEFAMRNGDVARLSWHDFREKDGTMFLCYTPRKTACSSGRVVAWPVHPGLWNEMCHARETLGERLGTHFQGLVVPAAHSVFQTLNRDIRARHLFTGTHKALYELRKICIDHVYQSFGAEMASSISGDDIRTVTRYYADPTAVCATGIRIVDLL